MALTKENYKLEEPEEVLVSKICHIVPLQQNIYIYVYIYKGMGIYNTQGPLRALSEKPFMEECKQEGQEEGQRNSEEKGRGGEKEDGR